MGRHGPSKKRGRKEVEDGEEVALPLPASSLTSQEEVEVFRAMVASSRNEHGATEIYRAGALGSVDGPRLLPLFTHTILCGLVPPFSAFFFAILEQYRI